MCLKTFTSQLGCSEPCDWSSSVKLEYRSSHAVLIVGKHGCTPRKELLCLTGDAVTAAAAQIWTRERAT
ncbi:hypothetical protein EX30DRAFT_344148 [Ascodesmis nigricans]|uniref:Uncharacterized protein n=1 Tax=Ascodesmis nigricans TaxID=341454 RepID=A0A4S2MKA2_9PEZI|nr:hypothetical protein EX30DRAFT_344148 [Ascodesmis nigricans]